MMTDIPEMDNPNYFDSLSDKYCVLCLGTPDEVLRRALNLLSRQFGENLIINIVSSCQELRIEYIRLSDFAIVCEDYLNCNHNISKLLSENILQVFYLPSKECPFSWPSVIIGEADEESLYHFFSILLENRSLRRILIQQQRAKTHSFRIQIEGSFDSSYSLAIVNREMALALEELLPSSVALYSTDGYGDFPPNPDFLRANPRVAELFYRSRKGFHYEVVLRNPFPPRVRDMKGLLNGTTSYGWEESEYPKNWIENFNKSLDFLAVMSPYVAKVMRDNGFLGPIYVVGLGGDHILRVNPEPYPLKSEKGFRFLHISSCFPRKGVDVLLRAYVSTFSSKDDCVLIIKTFPNPHHDIERQIQEIRAETADPPEIELINQDIPEAQIRWLIENCDVVVLPSRGEGFLLPALEAMFLKKPVITTAFGGQTFFCTEETAFLVPFRLTWAKSHLSTPYSYWAEPESETLSRLLRLFYETRGAHPKIREKVEKAYRIATEEFTWRKCAERLLQAIHKTWSQAPLKKFPLRIAWISSWNVPCGIAYYSQRYVSNFSSDLEVKVFSQRVDSSSVLSHELEKMAIRLFSSRLEIEGEVKELFSEILSQRSEVVVIQHHYAYFETGALKSLLNLLNDKNIPVILTLHALSSDDPSQDLTNHPDILKFSYRIIVHSLKDLNKLTQMGFWEKTLLLPIPVHLEKPPKDRILALRRKLGLSEEFVFGTFGFLRPHKGILKLLQAFHEVSKIFPKTKLLLITPLYPSKDSSEEYTRVQKFIHEHDLGRRVILITKTLSEDELSQYLSLIDLGVFPYEEISDSSSSAVRALLGVEVPVLCSPASIFEDLEEIAFFTQDFSVNALLRSMIELLENRSLLEKRRATISSFIRSCSIRSLAQRFENLLKASAN